MFNSANNLYSMYNTSKKKNKLTPPTYFFDNKKIKKNQEIDDLIKIIKIIKKKWKKSKNKLESELTPFKFLKNLKKKNILFLRVQSTNKYNPDIFLTKNFAKIKTIYLGRKDNLKKLTGISNPKKPSTVYCLFENLNIDIHFFLNKRFIFSFLNDFFSFMFYNKKKNFFFLQLYSKIKPLRFIKKYPKLKKKYRKKNKENSLINI